MYDPDKFKNKAARSKPSQDRGKERVRVILSAALQLFQEKGIDEVSTNLIAERAGIPIGSLYRYYPNKDSITAALTQLYVEDISRVFEQVGRHPMLQELSWDEVLLLMIDGWVNYSRLNGPFAFLYIERVNPKLHAQNKDSWVKFITAFGAVLKKRCPKLAARQLTICFSLSLACAELGINDEQRAVAGADAHHEAVRVVAAYLDKFCGGHSHTERH